MKWLLILILLSGCQMRWGNTEIGGADTGPATLRFNGEPDECQKYVYESRLLLGELKRQMQPNSIKSGQVSKTLGNGTKLHARSNQHGLAHIDDIWIETQAQALLPGFAIIIYNSNAVTDDDLDIFWGGDLIAHIKEPYPNPPYYNGVYRGTLIIPNNNFLKYYSQMINVGELQVFYSESLYTEGSLDIVSVKDNGASNYGHVYIYKIHKGIAELFQQGEYGGEFPDHIYIPY